MFVRDSLFIRKCTKSTDIVKTCLVGLLLVLKIGGEKHNITYQFKIQSSTPLTLKEHGL